MKTPTILALLFLALLAFVLAVAVIVGWDLPLPQSGVPF